MSGEAKRADVAEQPNAGLGNGSAGRRQVGRPLFVRRGRSPHGDRVSSGSLYLFLGHDNTPPPRQVREITVRIVPPHRPAATATAAATARA